MLLRMSARAAREADRLHRSSGARNNYDGYNGWLRWKYKNKDGGRVRKQLLEFSPALICLCQFTRFFHRSLVDFRPATWTDENPHSPVLDLGDILLNSPFELALRTKES